MNDRQHKLLGAWWFLSTVHLPGFPKLSTQISDFSGDDGDLDEDEDDDSDMDDDDLDSDDL